MKRISFLLLVVLLLNVGCAYQFRYQTGLKASDEKITERRDILGWGTSDTEPVDLDKLSPGEVAEFGSYTSFPDWLCAFFTLGFYTPQTVYVIPAASDQKVKSEVKHEE